MTTTVPNSVRFSGTVKTCESIGPNMGSNLTVMIDGHWFEDDLPNFLSHQIGNTLPVFVPPSLEEGLQAGTNIIGTMTYRGNPQGGLYAITSLEKHDQVW